MFIQINDFISKFSNMNHLAVNGMRIGDHLGELIKACKRPNLKSLELELNGIEAEFCLYFSHLINFETLESFNISNNWIGWIGVERMKDFFRGFKNLKVLKLSSNKLFTDEQRRTEDLKELILSVGHCLTELHLPDNSMKNEDLVILTPAIVSIQNLQVLVLAKNVITSKSVNYLLDRYI